MTTKRQKFDDVRYDLELQQIIADMRLKNRQHAMEPWKIVLLSVVATSAVWTMLAKWPEIRATLGLTPL
jgi:hypothetical protein